MPDMHPTQLARPTRAASGSSDHVAAVQVTNLSKSYGAVRAVDDLTMRIEPGEIVAVLGPNGGGKSTTNEAIELMAGLHAQPLAVGEVVERADLGDFLKTRTDRLSGGQAQRLRYALALLPDPDLLILDEPTVGMDVEARRNFWRSMREFADAGRTVLFATHYLDEADHVAERIVVLAAGRVVAQGTGDQIRSCVAGRTITLTATGLDSASLGGLPGVVAVETVGARWHLHSTDSDRTLRVLLRYDRVHDVEVTAAKLEDAFLALTVLPNTPQGATR
jgi:ABC-2 type transport system ATP-binding protein